MCCFTCLIKFTQIFFVKFYLHTAKVVSFFYIRKFANAFVFKLFFLHGCHKMALNTYLHTHAPSA